MFTRTNQSGVYTRQTTVARLAINNPPLYMNLHKFLSIYRAWFIYYINTARIKVEPILVPCRLFLSLSLGARLLLYIGQY